MGDEKHETVACDDWGTHPEAPMRTRATLVLLALVLAGCGVPGFDGTVRSVKYPGIEIRCAGGQPVPGDVCVVWAEIALADIPDMGTATVSGIVITFRGGDDGEWCSVTFYVDGREMYERGMRPCPGDAAGAAGVSG